MSRPRPEPTCPAGSHRSPWALTDAKDSEQQLKQLADELERSWPDAAGSLREGMTETLTLLRLGITGKLANTLASTNPIESMIEIVRYTQRNVKRWHDGDMRKRWSAAGMLQAEQQFRRIIATATSRSSSSRLNDATSPSKPSTTQSAPATPSPPPPSLPSDHHNPVRSPSKFHDEPGNLHRMRDNLPMSTGVDAGPVETRLG
jgi:hypothetical protein